MEFNKDYNVIFRSKLLEKYLETKGADVSWLSDDNQEAPFYLADGDYMNCFKEYCNSIATSMLDFKEEKVIKRKNYNLFWLINNVHELSFYDEIVQPEAINIRINDFNRAPEHKKRDRYITYLNYVKKFGRENKEYNRRADYRYGYYNFLECYGVLLKELITRKEIFERKWNKAKENLTKEEMFVIKAILLENLAKGSKYFSIDDNEYILSDFLK